LKNLLSFIKSSEVIVLKFAKEKHGHYDTLILRDSKGVNSKFLVKVVHNYFSKNKIFNRDYYSAFDKSSLDMKNNKDVVVPIKCDSHKYYAYFNNSHSKMCTSIVRTFKIDSF